MAVPTSSDHRHQLSREGVRRWARSSAHLYSGVKLGRLGLYFLLVAVTVTATRVDWRGVPAVVGHVSLAVGAVALAALAADYKTHPQTWGKRDVVPKPLWADRSGRREVDFVLRWVALVALVSAGLVYGARASLPPGTDSIIDVELAGSALAWEDMGVAPGVLREALAFDFLFIAAYVILLGLLALWAGSYYRLEWVRRSRRVVCFAVVLAGALDAVENALLWQGSHDRWPTVVWAMAATAAWAKFILLAVAVGYVAVGFQSWVSTPTLLRHLLWEETDKPRSQRMDENAASRRTVGEATTAHAPARLGIALSGGGIRAASISLGALQRLEAEGRSPLGPPLGWQDAAAVTAISGGSNMAAAWSITRSRLRRPRPDEYGDAGDTDLQRNPQQRGDPRPWSMDLGQHAMTAEEQHLLRNLGYLASNRPRGDTKDPSAASTQAADSRPSSPYRPAAVATVVTGFTVNVLLLLMGIWVLVRPLGWVFRAASGPSCAAGDLACLSGSPHLVTPGLVWTGIGFGSLLAWVVVARRVSRGSDRVRWRRRLLFAAQSLAYGSLALGVFLLTLLGLFPFAMEWAHELQWGTVSLASVAGLLGTVAAVGRLLLKPAARFAPQLGGVIALALVTFLAAVWAAGAAVTPPTLDGWGAGSIRPWVAAVAVLAAAYLFVSPESWSLAAFYRSKLRRAYATYRLAGDRVQPYADDTVATEDAVKEPGLADFETRAHSPAGTPLVVCAATTVSSRAVRTHYGIPALSVTFNPDRVTLHVPVDDLGDYLTYETSTRHLDQLGRAFGKRVTTMFAVAISSAAVSPAMGRFRVGLTSMLLTLGNVRLGVWVPNPRFTSSMAERLGETAQREEGSKGEAAVEERTRELLRETSYPMTRLGYLVKEFLGVHDLSDPFLYMTDGGHWENTGLVEMLRRPDITEIVCIDADSGPGDATRSVSKAIELAALECAVSVHLHLDVLRAELGGTNAPDYCARTVNLGVFQRKQDGRLGVIWYAKPGLTRDMPAELLAYRESHHDFPRITTLDQFFDTATFLAYRNLGRYNAAQLRRARTRLVELLGHVPEAPSGTPVVERLYAAQRESPGITPYDDWLVQELTRAAAALHVDEDSFCGDVLASLIAPPDDAQVPPQAARSRSAGSRRVSHEAHGQGR